MAPDREQLSLPRPVPDPAHDQPGGDRRLGGLERGEPVKGPLRALDDLLRTTAGSDGEDDGLWWPDEFHCYFKARVPGS